MTTNKHTPGEWEVKETGNGQLGIYAPGFGFVAFCHFDVYPDQPNHPWTLQPPANARLIAAAPKLLRACEHLLSAWDSLGACERVPDALNDTDDWSWEEVRSALAKARGES